MDWHEGYVSDIDYVAAFFPEQSPALLSFACLLNGCEPPSPEQHFRYFELGSGQGLTANILAAANPHADFYAADFNPAHIAASRQLAVAAGLQNIRFLESSFADLADGLIELPPLDFITMHGVYSWVNAQNRQHIMRFVNRYLKPGGLVYVSYNAMPGWTTTLPLQRLLLEHATLRPGSKHAQIEKARGLVRGLMETRAAYFSTNTSANLQNYLRSVMEQDPSHSPYLAHEYMNQGWEPLYHLDVAREAAQAKLDYVGSADLPWAFPTLYLTPEQREFLQEIQEPGLRETVKDYMKNTCFRKDIYVRGMRPISIQRQQQWFGRIGLALTVLRETVNLKMGFPIRQHQPDGALCAALLDALGQGPKSLNELRALPLLQDKSLAEITQLAALLVETGQVAAYFLQSAERDSAPAQRLNQAIAQLDAGYRVFASPLLGSGVAAPLFQRLVYDSLVDPQAPSMSSTDITNRVLRQVESQHQPILLNERELVSEQEKWHEVQETVKAILTRRRPFWKQLRMLPGTAAPGQDTGYRPKPT
jgi:SAM-dependent methyltransferase